MDRDDITRKDGQFIEQCWRLRAPSGRILECNMYRTKTGVEVRAGYGTHGPLHSHVAIGIATARAYAEELRLSLIAGGEFEDLPI